MPDKEKTKVHPFAGILRPGEEILWMSPESAISQWVQVIRLFNVVFVLIIVLFIGIVFEKSGIFKPMLVYIGVAAVIMLVMMLLPGPQRAYGVTTQRLLHRERGRIVTVPLEEILSVSFFKDNVTQAGLNFGPLFPAWINVPDVMQVKAIIEDAQKQHAQAIEHA